MKEFIKNASISTIANFFVLIVSALSTLLFPRVLSVSEYSYWQLYVFYTGFVTLAGIGIVEGVYLLNGGKEYKQLEGDKLSFCNYSLLIITIVIFTIIGSVFSLTSKDLITRLIILLACIEGIIYNLRVYPLFLFQATKRIKEFAIAIFLGRLAFIVFSLTSLMLGEYKLYAFILSDVIGCIACLIYSWWKSRDKILIKPCSFESGITYLKSSVKAGVNLLLATIIGVAIIGVMKYFIKLGWDIVEFGKISLILTFTNLFLKFATSVGQVLFPTLCNFSLDKLKRMFQTLIKVIDMLFVIIFVFYYPIQIIMINYLPKYADVLIYMSLLLPLCIFETKVALIFNTYCKALREEKTLMKINIYTFIVSLILAIVFSVVLKSITLCTASILFVIALRAIWLEIYISRKVLKIGTCYGVESLIISAIFVISFYCLKGLSGCALYSLFAITYIICNIKNIKIIYKKIKQK